MERMRKGTGPKTDWERIEEDFLATGLSYRALAEKHGLSLSTVKKRAAEGRWQERLLSLRREEERAGASTGGQLLELRENRRALLLNTADDLLEKLRLALDQLEPENTPALASLARTLKDLRELLGLRKDALDLEEQQARIEKMRSEIRKSEDEDGPAGVLILPEIRDVEDGVTS